MSLRAEIHALSAWTSVKLSPVMTTDNILQSIIQGDTMKILLESITGECPKRLGSLDGLAESQKVTRSEWFISALKNKEKIPAMLKVNMEMFTKGSKAHVLAVLWELACNDIKSMWKLSRVMQSNNDVEVIAEPFVLGPHTIYRSDEISLFHMDKDGKSIIRKLKKKSTYSYSQYLKRMITSQLESTGEPGCQDIIQSWDELLNNRIWCGLINSFLPGTFTTEVLLNDRWSINLALKVATKVFKINCLVDSEDLSQGDSTAISAFLTWFFLCGFQLRQAMAVVRRMSYLQEKITDLKKKYTTWQDSLDGNALEVCNIIKRKELETSMESTEKEIDWLSRVYDIEACTIWKEQTLDEQERVRRVIAQKMKDRFDVITLTRPSTIRDLVDNMVINLSLTGGNGFYLSDTKERWWPERKIVIRDTQTGEFVDDFSASSTDRALVTCREMLGLPANELVEVIPAKYPHYELYFESASRNKTMKGGSKFLYQVLPGTTEQCQRLLIRSAKTADLETIQKLIVFFKSTPSFINSQDPSTGNTALHIAARCSHLEVAAYLLQNNAVVNSINMVGCTPLFLAAESIHKEMCQLLLEWNASLQYRNRQSKTVVEVTRNANLRELLQTKDVEYSTLRKALVNGNISELLSLLKNHSSDKQFLINLQSRVCKGNTVFHFASKLGSLEAVKMCIDLHIDVNILNAQGATPLHLTRSLDVIKMLLEVGAAVNATTSKGNTVLHLLCKLAPSLATNNCIELLVSHGALLDVRNKEGFMPVHCTAVAGDCDRLSLLLGLDAQTGNKMRETLKEGMVEPRPSSLLYLSIENDRLKLAEMLEKEGLEFKEGEVDKLAALILTLKLPQTKVVSTYQMLLRHGASFNDNTCSPLCLAAMQPLYPEFVQLLLDQGADPNMVDSELGSPLFCACKANNPHAALVLLKAGANYSAENSQGVTPFDVIPEHRVWIRSGLFDEEMQSILTVHKWRRTKHLVSAIERKLHTTQGRY